jgi:hypothetical protein
MFEKKEARYGIFCFLMYLKKRSPIFFLYILKRAKDQKQIRKESLFFSTGFSRKVISSLSYQKSSLKILPSQS